MFFVGRPKTQQSSYHWKLITQSTLQGWSMAGISSGSTSTTRSPFSTATLQSYKTNMKTYRNAEKASKANNTVNVVQKPVLPWHPGLDKYYVPTNMIRTNGLELQVLAFDLQKPKPPPSRYKMAETQVNIEDIELKFPSALATRSVFGGRNVKVVGIDPGEVVSAAVCGINLDQRNPNK
ncbi:hypothetical protein BGZ58_006673, partial [Dissophora ornata]